MTAHTPSRPYHLAECGGSAHPWAQAENGIGLVHSVADEYLISKSVSRRITIGSHIKIIIMAVTREHDINMQAYVHTFISGHIHHCKVDEDAGGWDL